MARTLNKMNEYKLSIIIPCFNEENNIAQVIEETLKCMEELSYSIEIVVIDDGSSDNTYKIANEYANNIRNLKLIKHEENKGFGAAFWTGVLNAEGEYLVLVPGDGESNIRDALYGLALLDQVDLVIPFVYNKSNRSFVRRAISYLYTQIVNFTFQTRLNYTNGAVIYRSSVVRDLKLKSSGFFFQTEILMRLIKSGYLYAEVPVFLNKRSTGLSKALSPKSVISVSKDYLNTLIGIFITKKYLVEIQKESITYKRSRPESVI